MDGRDRLEDRITFLRHQVKQLEEDLREMRQIMNGLAHAVALLGDAKKEPLWVKEYYRKWENKHQYWWGLDDAS